MIAEYFDNYLTQTDDRMVMKWRHYFDIYAEELGPYFQKPVRFLEIGIYKGGSIPMWKGFFAPGSKLVFADIDPACRELAEPGTEVEIGDQADPAFLKALAQKHGPFDVILDDGGHLMHQQITSYQHLWGALVPGGRYLVEDTHTSYWPGFGGGYRSEGSFIEYAKRLVDTMHSWYTDQDALFPFDPAAREIDHVRFYDSIVAIRKCAPKPAPRTVSSKNGQISESQRALQIRNRKSVF